MGFVMRLWKNKWIRKRTEEFEKVQLGNKCLALQFSIPAEISKYTKEWSYDFLKKTTCIMSFNVLKSHI